MVHTRIKVRKRNMQKFRAILLTNRRPDLTTENHWMKKKKKFIENILTKQKYFFDWI